MKHMWCALLIAMQIAAGTAGLCQSAPDWSPIEGHQHNMVAYGKIAGESIDYENGSFLLFAFGPGGVSDCRSKSEVSKDGSFYATIAGHSDGEVLKFKLVNTQSGDIADLQEHIVFLVDDTLADLVLHL